MEIGLLLARVVSYHSGNDYFAFTKNSTAGTYMAASFFPTRLLDCLLNIPHVLIGIRNALLPVPPPIQPSVPASTERRALEYVPPPTRSVLHDSPYVVDTVAAPLPDLQITPDSSERESEPDSERSHDDLANSGVASSWVSLDERSPTW